MHVYYTLGVQGLEGSNLLDRDSWRDLSGKPVQGSACNDDPPDTDDTITQPCTSSFATSQ